jgi:hypothetical protein
MKMLKFGIVLVAFAIAAPSFAQRAGGGASGVGSGGSRVFVKGRWELADVFAHGENPGELMRLSPEMAEYITGITALIKTYGVGINQKFWKDHIFSPSVEFRSVETLPCREDPLPINDASLTQDSYGCTLNGVTYFVKSKLDEFGYRQKALAIIHERLHAYWWFKNHTDIAEVVDGLNTLILLKEEQNSGVKRPLTPPEWKKLDRLMNLWLSSHFRPWPNGGGSVHKYVWEKISDDTYIDIGSRVEGWGDHEIISSSIENSTVQNAKMSNARLRDSHVSGTVIDSDVTGSKVNSSVREGKVFFSEVKYGSFFRPQFEQCHLNVVGTFGDSLLCKNTQLKTWGVFADGGGAFMEIGEGVQLIDSTISTDRRVELAAGTRIQGLNMSNSGVDFDIQGTWNLSAVEICVSKRMELRKKSIRSENDLRKYFSCR